MNTASQSFQISASSEANPGVNITSNLRRPTYQRYYLPSYYIPGTMEFKEKDSISGSSHLWNFPLLQGSSNYNEWRIMIENALNTVGVRHVLTESEPAMPQQTVTQQAQTAGLSGGGEATPSSTLSTPADADTAAYNRAMIAWGEEMRLWKQHTRIARGHIFSKCGATARKVIENQYEAGPCWLLLRSRYADQGVTRRTTLWQRLATTTLGSCNNDLDVFITTLRGIQSDLSNMGVVIDEWIISTNLIVNLDGRFKDFVSRQVTAKELPSFDELAEGLNELDRLAKREAQTTAYRAQLNLGAKAAETKKKEQEEKAKERNKNKEKKHCAKCLPQAKGYKKCAVAGCGKPHCTSECWIDHPERKEEFEKKKLEKEKKANTTSSTNNEESTSKYAFAFKAKSYTMDSTPSSANISSTSGLANEWFVDSGCTEHMTPSRDDFIDYQPFKGKVMVANGVSTPSIGKGTVSLNCLKPDGTSHLVQLTGVLHVPGLTSALFSTSQITTKGGLVVFDEDQCSVLQKSTNNIVLHATKCRDQYSINLVREEAQYKAYSAAFYGGPKFNEKSMQLWHRRVGHLNRQDLIRLTSMSTGIQLTQKPKHTSPKCGSCQKGKLKRKPSRRPQDPVFEKNECMDSDIIGPLDPTTFDGFKYAAPITCRATGHIFLYLLKEKKDFFDVVENHLIPLLKTQSPGFKIKRWRSDEGSEIKNRLFKAFFAKKGIEWEPSAPYAKEQDGRSERLHLTVMNNVRAILEDAGLPFYLWGEVLKTVIYLKNRSPAARLRVQNLTPHEAYFGIAPDLSHLRLIGCDAWHAVSKEVKGQKKLSARGIKCKLLGYRGTNQYVLWNPSSRRVFTSRDVDFDESIMLEHPNKSFEWDGDTETSRPEDFEDDVLINANPSPNDEVSRLHIPVEMEPDNDDVALDNSDSDSESSAYEDATPGNTVGADGQLLHEDPHPDSTITERRSGRERVETEKTKLNEHWEDPNNWGKAANHVITQGLYEDLVAASEQAYCRQATVMKEEHLYDHDFDPDADFHDLIQSVLAMANAARSGGSPDEEPTSIKEAKAGPYAKQHMAALDAEMAAHKKMGTYRRVKLSSLPPGTKILSSRVVFKVKRDLMGAILKFKARWCARGFEQSFGVNFNETYASVVKSMSYKAILSIVALEDLDCEQMDIITAFLNSILKERIYIWPPEGFEEDGWVWLLLRALYGLKQSPREWYQTLSKFLISQGFKRLESDHSVFVNYKKKLIVPIYVDDLLLIGPPGLEDISKLKKALGQRFSMTDLGPCHHYLGMGITRDRVNKTLHLSQESYINKVLTRFGMAACKDSATPMDLGLHLEASEGYSATVSQVKEYQAIVGSLIYLSTQTRPDIAYAVQKLARFNLNPSKAAIGAAKKVLRYLHGTKTLGVTYGGARGLVGYTDADYAGDVTTRRSTGAYLFKLNGGVFSWSSKLQQCIALSSCEAEYMAQTQASKEAIWITRLLKELDLGFNLPTSPVSIQADNQGAIALSGDPRFHSRTKHIDVQWHFVREQVEKKAVSFDYCPTNNMAADGLTKPLDRLKFARFIDLMGMVKTP